MKRFALTLSLLIISIFLFSSHSLACDNCDAKTKECLERKKISDLNEEELKQFLENYVFTGTEDSESKNGMFELLTSFLHEFDSPGATGIPLNYTLYHVWRDQIDAGIEEYYGGAVEKRSHPVSIRATSYSPTQNVFYSVPNNMYSFNCYGYAVGLYGRIQPGFANNDVYSLPNTTAASLAHYVKRDLNSSYFNMKCVKLTPNCPSPSILSSGRNVICIRWGKRPDNSLYDYHLMKLTSNGWLHKPGDSAIIKHIKSLSPSTNWLCEYTYNGSNWGSDSLNYINQIYYIIYKANHSYSLTYTGNHYHSGKFHYYQKAYVCTDCGSSYGAYYEKVSCSGPPCIIPFNKIDDLIDR